LEILQERLADRDQRIAELLKLNAELIELSKTPPVAAKDEDEEPVEPQKPHRMLGAEMRQKFRKAAEARFRDEQINKGKA
jgi:hypothetical protein